MKFRMEPPPVFHDPKPRSIIELLSPKPHYNFIITKEGETMEIVNDPTAHDWVGTIKTNSGIAFDMKNPTPDMVDINDIATALGMICRYNGQIPTFYSVAEHSVRVAAWLEDNGYPELALQGLMHDAAEAYLGDIVRPMKLMQDFAPVYNELERKVEEAIGQKFDLTLYPMHPKVKEADKAVYEWEVDNIRSGSQMGLGHLTAIGRFRDKFDRLLIERRIRSATDRALEKVDVSLDKDAEYSFEKSDDPSDAHVLIDKIDVAEMNADHIPAWAVQDEQKSVGTEPNHPNSFAHSISDSVPTIKPFTGFHLDTQLGEVRVTNPITGGEKGSKLERFDLVPVYPLTVLARHYGLGAQKYESNQWRKGYDWSLSYAALQRHLTAWWNGEDNDPELGDSHLAAVAWHAFALLEFSQAHPELDDRFDNGN